MMIIQKVEEFHKVFGQPVMKYPIRLPKQRMVLRCNLMAEEAEELESAITSGDMENTLKEAVDLIYVIAGTVIESGYQDLFTEEVDSRLSGLFIGSYKIKNMPEAISHLKSLPDVFETAEMKEMPGILAIGFIHVVRILELLDMWEFLDNAFEEVHQSNMSKIIEDKAEAYSIVAKMNEEGHYKSGTHRLKVSETFYGYKIIRLPDGKVIKPTTYRKADMSKIICTSQEK